ncbi:uncharacterized protein LOC123557065 [Mercenaria mercenaria]|uniref:uncharacterized protein LOC123557065 n=1 Tax=Mercenaria mercenaria TaxID=6596 RepID=UPI00234F4C4C|nr:uncharacterized protein LOC123557065 [Mercenaria mercenaria]
MMEVSGKRKDQNILSASRGSAEDFVLFCIPCDREGAREPAYGYCKSCQEHLCETCFKHHRKPAPLRNHVLLDKDSMPTTPSVSNPKDDFESCHEHEDRNLEFYCRDHSTVVCGICVTLDHRVCKVEYIPKLSKNILDDGELEELIAEMETLRDNCKSRNKKAKEHMRGITQNHEDVLKEIRQFRKEINRCVDEMELNVTREAANLINAQLESFGRLSTYLEDIIKEVEVSQAYLDGLVKGNRLDKLFVEMKKANTRFTELAANERQAYKNSELRNLEFVKNQVITEMLQSQTQLGKLISVDTTADTVVPTEDKTVVLQHVGEINVISPSDEKENGITGIDTIQPDRIVVCDSHNKKIKCYNTMTNKIVSELRFDNLPFDVAVITDNKIVTTVPTEKSIYFVSLTNTSINSDRKVNVNETCNGIAYSQNKLVVVCNYNPAKMLIVDLNGKILQSFCANKLFTLPFYLTVNTDGTYIYVSDRGYNIKSVKQLDWQGNTVNIYQASNGGTFLNGICELDDGTFLICLSINDKDNVIRMTSSFKQCKITWKENLGDWFPKAVTYCKKTKTAFVSYSEGNFTGPFNRIKVFKVGWC